MALALPCAAAFHFCIVPDSSYDAVLFVAVALLVATAASIKMSALNVLLVGGCGTGMGASPVHIYHMGCRLLPGLDPGPMHTCLNVSKPWCSSAMQARHARWSPTATIWAGQQGLPARQHHGLVLHAAAAARFAATCHTCHCPAVSARFGNSISLWLGMEPAEVFFYVFLPPLLLDSSLRVDFFLFKKASLCRAETWQGSTGGRQGQ